MGHPYLFFLLFTGFMLGMGIWLGLALRAEQVRRLKNKLWFAKMGL